MTTDLVKSVAIFAAGVAIGVVVSKNSKEIRNVCVKSIGSMMDLKDRVMEKAEIIKETAEDLIAESDAKRKESIEKEA